MAVKPKLGQNFLRDPQAIRRIVAAIGDLTGRTVVEIGPGKGAITEGLSAQAGRLIAVEMDRELAWNLQERFSPEKGCPNVNVVRQDILTFDFAAAAKVADLGGTEQNSAPSAETTPLLVVGNLPYYITSPILLRLAANAASLDRAVLMVQREVADRVTAKPGSRDYGLLSVTLQLYGSTESLFTLPPEAFSPPPEVHSTVFRWKFAPRFASLGVEEDSFIRLLKQSFAQKRKTLSNNLRAAGHSSEKVAETFHSTGISPQIRAEALAVEDLAAIWRVLQLP
jgi:16S rRNA (adenine1518-N6/adenine1519-N6)-dimethyltransferase